MAGVRRHLDACQVAQAVQLVQDGTPVREVARRFGVSPSTVSRLWTRFRETGLYTRRPGQGRRRLTTPRQDRYLRVRVGRHRRSTAQDLQEDLRRATGVRVSDQTVRNRLHGAGLRARRPLRAVPLTAAHRAARLQFAQDHRNWQLRHWRPVLFTDESRYTLSSCDGRDRTWRRVGERYQPDNIVEHDRFGGGSVMVWGGISLDGHTDLHVLQGGTLTAVRYRDEILGPIVRPYAGAIGPQFLLMQDNARPHTARASMQFLNDESIDVMDWPARSPDLNPIEHVWDTIQRRLRRRPRQPRTVQELADALVQEWQGLTQPFIRRLIRSMPQRCRACINARGGHTRYWVTSHTRRVKFNCLWMLYVCTLSYWFWGCWSCSQSQRVNFVS